MKQITWIVLGCLALLTTAQAASFDCNKVSSRIEKMICSSKELSKWDDDLGIVYKNLLDNTTDEFQKKYLVSEQRNWIANIRNACRNEACLNEAYNIRTLYFRGVNAGLENANSPDTFELVTAPDKVASIVKDFQNDLTRFGIDIRLRHCPIVLSAPFYRAQVNGVICNYGDNAQHSLLMCNESMVGHFVIQVYGYSTSPEDVKAFAKSNCFKGG
jgi:uncharacterized protein YecT (DUF1311 family)